jgi:hypothetical protein
VLRNTTYLWRIATAVIVLNFGTGARRKVWIQKGVERLKTPSEKGDPAIDTAFDDNYLDDLFDPEQIVESAARTSTFSPSVQASSRFPPGAQLRAGFENLPATIGRAGRSRGSAFRRKASYGVVMTLLDSQPR